MSRHHFILKLFLWVGRFRFAGFQGWFGHSVVIVSGVYFSYGKNFSRLVCPPSAAGNVESNLAEPPGDYGICDFGLCVQRNYWRLLPNRRPNFKFRHIDDFWLRV